MQNPADAIPQDEPEKKTNPLLDALGPRIGYYNLAAFLAHKPLSNLPPHASFDEREDMLAMSTMHFSPTPEVIDIVASAQNMLREGYVTRDFRDPKMKMQLYAIAEACHNPDAQIEWFSESASGMIIEGISGVGKSTLLKRYLSRIPQVVIHDDVDGLGWKMKQLVWLSVDMSPSGTRAGLAFAIFAAVDRVLGTNYHDTYSRGKITVDRLLLRAGMILASHACGLLVIDEIQEKNFDQSASREEITNFFLSWMNTGIPTIMMGNPLGFVELMSAGQTIRRMTKNREYYLWPHEEASMVWNDDVLPGIWEFDVMPIHTPLSPEMKAAMYMYSGGIFDYAMRLRVDMMRIALRLEQSEVTLENLQQAFGNFSPKTRKLIYGVVNKDVNYIMQSDMPYKDFLERWKIQKDAKKDAEKKDVVEDSPPTTSPIVSTLEKGLAQDKPTSAEQQKSSAKKSDDRHQESKKNAGAQLKRARTMREKKEQKDKELKATITAEDMRNGKDAKSIQDMFGKVTAVLRANANSKK